ncbi:MAG: hypothetical protein ABJM26_22115 [Anderseniella sp.]|uniref:hypothetical protein n=1 Tax=Parasphingorhabdus sp. TaxID=2709688 RepID=UPI00327A9C1A
MRKQAKSRKPSAKKSKPASQAAAPEPVDTGRRGFISSMRNGAIGLVAVGGLGAFVVHLYQSTSHEHDLSRVGNGTASVVQIHDPQCQLCLALQKKTRQALASLDGDKPGYVIADIRTDRGLQFANKHGVKHVTLLLFDKAGKLQQVINGQRGSGELRQAFARLVAR